MTNLSEQQINDLIAKHKRNLPVHVGRLAEELGLTVISTPGLPSGMSGSIVKEGEKYTIYVNSKQALQRQRFTIAHEIGHFLKHRSYLDEADEILNPVKKVLGRRDSDVAAPTVPEARRREQEADSFAAELLMPENTFKEVWFKAQSLKDVADHFGVSAMAANVRAALLNLGYFDELNGTAQ